MSVDPDSPVVGLREAQQDHLPAVLQVAVDPIGGAISAELTDLPADGGTQLNLRWTRRGRAHGPGRDAMALTSRGLTVPVRGVTVGRWLINASEALRAQDIDGSPHLAQERPDLFDPAAQYDLAHLTDAVQHMERPGKTGTVLRTSPAA